jgi:hypothetical protein
MRTATSVPLALTLLALALALTVPAGAKPGPKPRSNDAPQALVMQRCTACHNTKRICAGLGRKNLRAWTTTVQRMVRHGAGLNPAQSDAVAAWLDSRRPGSPPLCP